MADEANKKERLDKMISSMGRYSRREVRELVRSRRICVNGILAEATDQKIGESDEVSIDRVSIKIEKYSYIMMNKPSGVVCATSDRLDKTVLDLLPAEMRRPGLFPAGRLDKDAEGFVLITNDGGFAHKILSPRGHIPKTYFVRLDTEADAERLAGIFSAGMDLGGGDFSSPAELLQSEGGPREFCLTIYEGVYHQIKRMFAMCGHKVVYLKRIRMGSMDLDDSLAPGNCKVILHNELQKFYI